MHDGHNVVPFIRNSSKLRDPDEGRACSSEEAITVRRPLRHKSYSHGTTASAIICYDKLLAQILFSFASEHPLREIDRGAGGIADQEIYWFGGVCRLAPQRAGERDGERTSKHQCKKLCPVSFWSHNYLSIISFHLPSIFSVHGSVFRYAREHPPGISSYQQNSGTMAPSPALPSSH